MGTILSSRQNCLFFFYFLLLGSRNRSLCAHNPPLLFFCETIFKLDWRLCKAQSRLGGTTAQNLLTWDDPTELRSRLRSGEISPTILVIIFWNFTIFQYISNSPKIKRNLICSIANLVYELPHELPNDLKLRILWN